MQEIKKGWKNIKIGDLCSNITDGTHSTVKNNDKGKYFLLSCKNIKFGNIVIGVNERKIDEETFLRLNKRTKLEKDDVLITTVGTIGEAAIIKTNNINFEFQRSVAILKPNNSIINPSYLYYYISGDSYQNLIKGLSRGAAQQCLFLEPIRNSEILLPPLPTQQKIASVLSKYDDLIENNNKRIKNLEETAQAIYEEWFVNYNFPGSENVKMVDSGNDDFGMIPEGWEIGKIKDFGDVITGKTPSKKKEENYGDFLPFVKTPDLHGNIYCLDTNEYLSEIGVNTQKNKIIPKNSLVVSCIGSVGVVGITSQDVQTNQQINSIILNNKNSLEYLFFLLRDLKSYLEKLGASGATLFNVNKEKFSNVNILYPNQDVLGNYSKIIKPNFEEILNLQKQNQNLKQTRDLLIPRLVSGELDVEDLDVK